ncbi:hypothetical protein [Pseudoleptotrichia goodfellowii]|uniref:Uncharacterized protein n=1 Tax=Pseudoleptotrichia goodfellowii F0264 TaxID=596323 RepID=D0GJ01_9FUSO|nr:hypothetical protein [Pseudoleptotrichia goodfellowii]EEY35966.1 hypothetical protein HMPREF0554_1273 [Pseudoleptotrichia goodfellowii F0264]
MKKGILKKILFLFSMLSVISMSDITTIRNAEINQKSEENRSDKEKLSKIKNLIGNKKYDEGFEMFYKYYSDITDFYDDQSIDLFVNYIKNENEKIKNTNPKLYQENIKKFKELEISPVIMTDAELKKNNKEIEIAYLSSISKEKFLKGNIDIQEEYFLNDLSTPDFIITVGFDLGRALAEFDTAKRKIEKIYYETPDKAYVTIEIRKLATSIFLKNEKEEEKIKSEIAERFKKKTGKTVEEVKTNMKTKDDMRRAINDYSKVTETVFKEYFSRLTKKDYENENNYYSDIIFGREIGKQNGKWKWNVSAFD